MTTTVANQPDGPMVARTAPPRAEAACGALTFDGVLRGEWIKLLSLRSIRWSLGVMIALSWGGATLLSWSMSDSMTFSAGELPSILVQSASLGSVFTVLIMGVIGVLAITSEYASGLILSTLTAVPARTPVFAAKALVVAAIALMVGALSTFGSGIIAATFFGGDAFSVLFEPAVMLSLLGTTMYFVLAALMSFGIGALLRSSAGAISVVVVLLFVSTIALQILLMTDWAWVPVVSDWMPASLGQELSTAALIPADAPADAHGVGYWAALGGLAAWAAAALVPAAILLKTRDAV